MRKEALSFRAGRNCALHFIMVNMVKSNTFAVCVIRFLDMMLCKLTIEISYRCFRPANHCHQSKGLNIRIALHRLDPP